MNIDTRSVQFSASYGSAAVKTKPAPMENLSFDNAVNITDCLEIRKGTWEELVGLQTTDVVAEDGTVTRTMTGGTCFLGAESRGSTSFSVSLTFDPNTYEGGDLGATADLLAAAHAAQKAAWQDTYSGAERDEKLHQLDVVYQHQKTEVSVSFSKMVGGYLESCNRTGEEEQKVYKSVQALFASSERKYRAVIAENSQDSWMGKDLAISMTNLRKLAAFAMMDGGGMDGLYSLQELEAAAARVCRGFSIQA